ncbi:hypothetical protein QUF64_16400 [Anaerolineales bacterium HSG6]|nr:hypothetical protein [Anaerolineales bacterium HSG6]MDM8532233.1 hypothetical protein [Anaerolineales bacterium HSG25]
MPELADKNPFIPAILFSPTTMPRPKPRYKKGDKIAGRYHVHDVKMGGMGEVYLCLGLEIMQITTMHGGNYQ